MPLVFSPLSEEVLDSPPKKLYPRTAFIMRQIGDPPALDLRMTELVTRAFKDRDIAVLDAGASNGGKDYLERILGLIRGTAFTVAIFSHETRATAMANIALELGLAAMCGKPLMILKSKEASAPSDLTRTDWIDYDAADETPFSEKILLAVDGVDDLAELEETVLAVALDAPNIDCAIALERVTKAFLITGQSEFIASGELVSARIAAVGEVEGVDDLTRLRREAATFTRQAKQSLRPSRTKA